MNSAAWLVSALALVGASNESSQDAWVYDTSKRTAEVKSVVTSSAIALETRENTRWCSAESAVESRVVTCAYSVEGKLDSRTFLPTFILLR